MGKSGSILKSISLIKIGGIIVVIILVVGFVIISNKESVSGEYDEFAKCLSEKGVKIFGAYWCPHCADQKKMFGNSWKHVDYVECSLPNRSGQMSVCRQNNIESYPTWEFQDSRRIEGKLSFEQLSQNSGCKISE